VDLGCARCLRRLADLIKVYARWLRALGCVAAFGIGLQIGGAVANLLDRVILSAAPAMCCMWVVA
jgi:lipoprotein signal peptidase